VEEKTTDRDQRTKWGDLNVQAHNEKLIDGIVHNNIKIPRNYFDRSFEERLKRKNMLLEKF